MVRPHRFQLNSQTAEDNGFQTADPNLTAEDIQAKAYAEVSAAVLTLESYGVKVHVFEDQTDQTPDSVFPNNWFSTHSEGRIAVYPMYAENRRLERRSDILEFLKKHYSVHEVIDYSGCEFDDCFLEGTGAMVLDHSQRVAYTCLSNRAQTSLLARFCAQFAYQPMSFNAFDKNGVAVYHTNVMMNIATNFVLIAAEMIRCDSRRQEILNRLEQSGRDIIQLSRQQVAKFAGNALELSGTHGSLLALSTTAMQALTSEQIGIIEKSAQLVALDVPTIEMAGGSIRCMMAGVHLSLRL